MVEQLQGLNLATPVLDVHMPYVFLYPEKDSADPRCPYNTKLMSHAEPDLKRFIDNTKFRPANPDLTIIDPVSTGTVSLITLLLSFSTLLIRRCQTPPQPFYRV